MRCMIESTVMDRVPRTDSGPWSGRGARVGVPGRGNATGMAIANPQPLVPRLVTQASGRGFSLCVARLSLAALASRTAPPPPQHGMSSADD